ncbi:MAG: endonuclease/exonuclease/phosphatase family protein [Moraxellaceae bacterium]
MFTLLLCFFSAPLQAAQKDKSCAPPVSTLRPVPAAKAGEFSIGTQNLERFFDDEPGGRGEVRSSEHYQQKLVQLAAQVVDVLRSPAVLAVQEAENIKVLEDLAAAISARQGGIYRALLVEGNDYGGIDVGFLLRRDLEVVKVEALLKQRRLDRNALFDRPPLRLTLRLSSAKELELINVHLKSLRGSEDETVAKKTARKRQRQAEVLAEWLSAELAMHPEKSLLVLGDFNATPDVLGGVDVLGLLQASGLVDVDERLPPAEHYSYIHDCRGEALDHVLVSPALLPAVQAVAVSRGNAGARKKAGAPAALRSSDHDGLVLYLRLP